MKEIKLEKQLSILCLLGLITTCGLLVVSYMGSMWSGSIDLAHHYALAFRLLEHGMLTSLNDPTLGEMNIYPRGGHIIAAIIGYLSNSIFLGVQITALSFLALLWLAIVLILNSLQGRLAVASTLCFVALVAINSLFIKLNIHGHEIIGNFFFSQLIAQSALYLSVLFAIHLEKKRGVLPAVALLIVLMLMNALIHLLPAIEMLGLIYGLLFSYLFIEHKRSDNFKLRLLGVCFVALLATVCMFFHPSFSVMKTLSQNNGGLHFTHVKYPYGFIVLCALVFLLSFKLLLSWLHSPNRRKNIAIKYFSFLGAATSALCLLQFSLTWLGVGSDYAVKKYGFGLLTILLIDISILAASYICRQSENNKWQFLDVISQFKSYILASALCVLFVSSLHSKNVLDVFDIVLKERKLIEISKKVMPAPAAGQNNVVIGLSNVPRTINYMFSIAITKTERSIAIPDLLVNDKLSNLSHYSYIISTYTNTLYGANTCESLTQGDLSIISSACLKQSIPEVSLH